LDRRAFRLLFVLILVLRVAICAQPLVMYDAFSYAIVGQAVSSGHDVYAATTRYNYTPLWSRVLGALWSVAQGEMMRFVLFVGLLLNAADAATSLLLLRIARRPGLVGGFVGDPRRLALLFLSNPVSVLVTCTLRQFDGLAILFLLAGLLAARETPNGRWLASLSLGASLLVKHVTALHPLVFVRRRRNGIPDALAALPYALFALSFLPHLASMRAIRDNVLLYGTGLTGARGQRPGGLQTFVAAGAGNRYAFFALFLGFAGAALWLGRRLPLPRACLLLSLAALVGAPGFAAQYLVWPVALGSLYPSAGYALAATLGAAFMVSEAGLAPLPLAIPASAAWLGALVWLALELRAALEARRYGDGVADALQSSSTASG
jgi:hypothetical protein